MAEQIEVFRFLVQLRDSGETNMRGAITYIQLAFGVSYEEAKGFLGDWIGSFSLPEGQQPADGRRG